MRVGFLEEKPGVKSSNRLIFIVGVIWSMVVSTVMLLVFKWTAGEFIAVFTSTSAVFFGGKLIQKPMEKSDPEQIV
jgi:hypothetical protein